MCGLRADVRRRGGAQATRATGRARGVTTPASDGTDAPAPVPVEDAEEAVAQLALGGGELVVYDPENHRAWLHSDVTVAVTP